MSNLIGVLEWMRDANWNPAKPDNFTHDTNDAFHFPCSTCSQRHIDENVICEGCRYFIR